MRTKVSLLLLAFLILVVAVVLLVVATMDPCDDGAQARVVGVEQR